MVSGAGLQPVWTAMTVRVTDGATHVQDGSFADTKELLGGFFIIDVPDPDAALGWAARGPAAAAGSVAMLDALPEGRVASHQAFLGGAGASARRCGGGRCLSTRGWPQPGCAGA